MTITRTATVLLLLQGSAVLRDTVLMRQVPPVRNNVETLFFYASGLTSILALALLVTMIITLFWLRAAAAAASERVDELLEELRPMLQQAVETSDSVRKTADLIHGEVALAKDGVHETGARVKKTVGELADRVDDFNALLGKVHTRADAVVGVAGTAMDGIAWGVKKLRERKRKRIKRK